MNPTIRIHIDHLVLEGVDVAPHQRTHLKAAIEAALAAQLTQHVSTGQVLPPQLQANTHLPHISLDLVAPANRQPLAIGQQISHTIHSYLTRYPNESASI